MAACLLAAVASAALNAAHPDSSPEADRLSLVSKAHIAEVTHLRRELGDVVWPGWGGADIPVVLFNERYAFLAIIENPPDGWRLPRHGEVSGSAWEVVPGDDLDGQAYFRQAVEDANRAIGNFTVILDERWAASMATQEWGEIAFRTGFREDLPPLVREVFPYGLAYRQLFGRSDVYLGGLAHEAFHAYQGEAARDRLVEAEQAAALVDEYPWSEEAVRLWRAEASLLRQALQSGPDGEAAALAGQFLAARDERRASTQLGADFIAMERQREWLEGLAKYAELSLGRAAAVTAGYAPVPAMQADRGFKGWGGYAAFYDQQVGQMDKLVEPGETWFYYSGMAQAALLDRFQPGWKEKAFEPGVFLEDLLRESLAK